MSSRPITDALLEQVVQDLVERYGMDMEDVRDLGSRLAELHEARRSENVAFAKAFVAEHPATFDRLSQ